MLQQPLLPLMAHYFHVLPSSYFFFLFDNVLVKEGTQLCDRKGRFKACDSEVHKLNVTHE